VLYFDLTLYEGLGVMSRPSEDTLNIQGPQSFLLGRKLIPLSICLGETRKALRSQKFQLACYRSLSCHIELTHAVLEAPMSADIPQVLPAPVYNGIDMGTLSAYVHL